VLLLLPEPKRAYPVDTAGAGKNCFVVGVALGVALLTLLRGLDRSAHRGENSVLLAAAASGLLANLALCFHCPLTGALHLATVHAPIGFVLLLSYRRLLRYLDLRSSRATAG
jgi:hypothetical protein